MRIVHVLPGLTKGGAERVAVDLANGSVAAGHHVAMVLAHPVDPTLLQDELDPRIELKFVRKKASRPGAYPLILPWMARNYRWLRTFDIMHCHLTFGSVFAETVRWLRAKDGAPRILETYHAVGAPLSAHRKMVHRWLAARHDGFVIMAEDEHWTQFLKRHPTLLSAYIPNGVNTAPTRPDPRAIADFRRSLGIPPDALVFGTVGRLEAERHSQRLMDVFLQVANALPGVHILVGGEGSERDALSRRVAEAGLARRVHFPGLIRNPRLVACTLDLYLTLNVGSITGLAALEASALNVPLVGYQANPAFKPGLNDWIMSSTEPGEVAQTAIALLQDEGERRKIAARQKTVLVERYSVQRMQADYNEFYERLLANSPVNRR